jgi:hypothetical protein
MAQSDLSAWIGADLKCDLSKKWSLGLEAQSRTDLRQRKLDAFLISPSISWKPKKHLVTGISYRATNVPYSKNTTNRVFSHRITADVTFQKLEDFFLPKKSRLGISLRLRGTTEQQAEKRTENTLRLKFKLEYNLPKTKLDLFASTELFYRFQRDLVYTFSEVQSINAINKYRVKVGLSYPFGPSTIRIYGLSQWRYPNDSNELLIGLSYSYEIKTKK